MVLNNTQCRLSDVLLNYSGVLYVTVSKMTSLIKKHICNQRHIIRQENSYIHMNFLFVQYIFCVCLYLRNY